MFIGHYEEIFLPMILNRLVSRTLALTACLCGIEGVLAQAAPQPAPGQQVPAVTEGVTANAQGYSDRMRADIPRTTEAPKLDGDLNDAAWKNAALIDDFHQYLPIDHGEPSARSELHIMYDDDYLYIGAKLYDDEPEKITARQLIQGQGIDFDDWIGFIIDPYNNQRAGYMFQINPNGVRRDGLFEDGNRLNADWDGIWLGEARIDAEGWSAEIAIPFKTLNFDVNNPDWGFAVIRAIARKNERLAWTSYNRSVSPGTAGVLAGLRDVKQGKGLDIIPSITAGSRHDYSRSDTDSIFEPSLDISYKFTPSLTGVLTFNTDFSATEVDDRQVNLTRFSLFFPEKRDFFLQDSDIFSFGGMGGGPGIPGGQNGLPFFSRNIGLSRFGQPVDLNAGAKLTGRVGRWNIGSLFVRQGGIDDVDPSLLMVSRVSANVLEESSIGTIMTYGDPHSNLDNALVGADFRYRNTRFTPTHSLTGNLWYQHTESEGLSGGQWAWGAQAGLNSAEGFHGSLSHDQFGENYNPALGFANRVGIMKTQVFLGYRWRPSDSYLRSIHPMMRLEHVEKIDGGVDTQTIFARPLELENHRGDQVAVVLFYGREVLDDPFPISRGVVIAPGDYRYFRYGAEWRLASERVLSPGMSFWLGEFYNGERLAIDGWFDWRPNEHFLISASYSYNNIDLPAGHFQTRVIQLRANWAFDSKWSWINLMQYDNFSNSVGFNSRLRWNRTAGEDLYLVFNHNFNAEGTFSGLTSTKSEILLKYTRTFRF